MKKYVFTSLLTFTLFSVNGQIIYESISEIYPYSGHYEFDVDNNGQMDFRISFSSNTATFIGLNETEFETNGTFLMGYNSGVQLGNGTYESEGVINASNPYFPLTGPTETLKYAGFRFKIDGTYRCGYVLVGKILPPEGGIRLKYEAHAYEQNANTCIETGAMPSGVGLNIKESSQKVTITPNPSTGIFKLDLGDQYSSVTIKLTDLYGRKIAFYSEQKEQFLTISIQEPAGVYLLITESEDKQEITRLIKE